MAEGIIVGTKYIYHFMFAMAKTDTRMITTDIVDAAPLATTPYVAVVAYHCVATVHRDTAAVAHVQPLCSLEKRIVKNRCWAVCDTQPLLAVVVATFDIPNEQHGNGLHIFRAREDGSLNLICVVPLACGVPTAVAWSRTGDLVWLWYKEGTVDAYSLTEQRFTHGMRFRDREKSIALSAGVAHSTGLHVATFQDGDRMSLFVARTPIDEECKEEAMRREFPASTSLSLARGAVAMAVHPEGHLVAVVDGARRVMLIQISTSTDNGRVCPTVSVVACQGMGPPAEVPHPAVSRFHAVKATWINGSTLHVVHATPGRQSCWHVAQESTGAVALSAFWQEATPNAKWYRYGPCIVPCSLSSALFLDVDPSMPHTMRPTLVPIHAPPRPLTLHAQLSSSLRKRAIDLFRTWVRHAGHMAAKARVVVEVGRHSMSGGASSRYAVPLAHYVMLGAPALLEEGAGPTECIARVTSLLGEWTAATIRAPPSWAHDSFAASMLAVLLRSSLISWSAFLVPLSDPLPTSLHGGTASVTSLELAMHLALPKVTAVMLRACGPVARSVKAHNGTSLQELVHKNRAVNDAYQVAATMFDSMLHRLSVRQTRGPASMSHGNLYL